jgi:hypothetical protein
VCLMIKQKKGGLPNVAKYCSESGKVSLTVGMKLSSNFWREN